MFNDPSPLRLFDLQAADRLWLRGADTPSFLNRLLSVDTLALPEGRGGPCFLLDARARVRAMALLYRVSAEDFLVELAPGQGPAFAEMLDHYHFGERFEVQPGPEAAYTIFSAQADALQALPLGALGVALPARGQVVAAGDVYLMRGDRFGVGTSLDVWGPAERLAALRAEWALPEVSARAEDQARIIAGVPRWPAEYGPQVSPLDVHTQQGVTEQKGCYPGQEVIERTLAIGRPAQVLVGLWAEAEIQPGDVLWIDGAERGRITSAGDAVAGRWPALALARRKGVEGAIWQVKRAEGAAVGATRRAIAMEGAGWPL